MTLVAILATIIAISLMCCPREVRKDFLAQMGNVAILTAAIASVMAAFGLSFSGPLLLMAAVAEMAFFCSESKKLLGLLLSETHFAAILTVAVIESFMILSVAYVELRWATDVQIMLTFVALLIQALLCWEHWGKHPHVACICLMVAVLAYWLELPCCALVAQVPGFILAGMMLKAAS